MNKKTDPKTRAEALGVRTAIARRADTLRQNLQDMIDRNGLEKIGFLTLTFKENITSRTIAEKRFHSFATHILRLLVAESITVPERQERGAIHYHLAAAFKFDIRSGFDVAACSEANLVKKQGYLGGGQWAPGCYDRFKALERKYLASANPALKRVWRIIRQANERIEKSNGKKHGRNASPAFGRCETLPILSNAEAIAFYVGTYITSQTEQRQPEDKGMRSVRYSLKGRRFHQSFHFKDGGNAKWRAGCRMLEKLLLIHHRAEATRAGKKLVFIYAENHVRSRFGPRWAHRLAPWVFACSEHGAACVEFAAQLAPDLPWRARLLAVGQFMDRLTGKALRLAPARTETHATYILKPASVMPKPNQQATATAALTNRPSPRRQRVSWIEMTAGND